MRDFFYSLRATCLFVCTVIGAGFATGEEIKLYFAYKGDGTLILSAFVFAVMSFVFLLSSRAKSITFSKFINFIIKSVRILVICLSFIAMCSAGEKLIKDFLGISFGGVLLFIICLFFAEKPTKILANINFFILPVIAIFVIVVYMLGAKSGLQLNKLDFLPAFLYASMNVFGAGIMLKRLGESMTIKQCVLSAIFTFLIVGLLMVCIKKSIENEVGAMPLVCVSNEVGVGGFAFITVLLSIFTTLLSDVNIIYPDVKNLLKSERLTVMLTLIFAFFASNLSFSGIVEKGYPLISYSGVVYFTYALVTLFFSFLFKKGNQRIHTAR